MSEEKINQFNTKLEVMQEKFENLESRNSDEHKAIFNKLNSIDQKLEEQNTKESQRNDSYIKHFVKQEDFNKLAVSVDVLNQFYWKALAVVSTIILIATLFKDRLLNN